MATASTSTQTVIFIKETGLTINKMVSNILLQKAKELTFLLMVVSIKATSKMVNQTDREL
jgi:hypothetical protein